MARNAVPPILTAEPGLTHYLEKIRRFPMLKRQEEYVLAKRWREHGDRDAAHKLVTSHLRLVTKIARDSLQTPQSPLSGSTLLIHYGSSLRLTRERHLRP
jgi:DNA-directed RNA polymerase sigma subunit (sigma70/sigma32)